MDPINLHVVEKIFQEVNGVRFDIMEHIFKFESCGNINKFITFLIRSNAVHYPIFYAPKSWQVQTPKIKYSDK